MVLSWYIYIHYDIRIHNAINHPCAKLEFVMEKKQFLVGGIPTPLKNMSSSVGATIPNWKVIQKSMVPVTTNQDIIEHIYHTYHPLTIH